MTDEDDPFAPIRPMKLAASSRKPGKPSHKIKKAALAAVPCLSIEPPLDPTPFAEVDRFALEAVPASDQIADPPTPRMHSLDDPFSDELSLPFIAVGRSKVWNGRNCVPHLLILQIGLDPTETVRQFSLSAEQEALRAAADVAATRNVILLCGVQSSDVIAAIEEGIKAAVRCRRLQALS